MPHFRSICRAVFGATIFGLVLAVAPSASAAVYSTRQALPADTIQKFLADPAALLSQFPNGGPLMITRVRDLAASDPAAADALIGLLKTANSDQSSAIGTALGQVALMAVTTDQVFAVDLQTKIAQSGNTSALVAFGEVVGGDIKLTAATGTTGGAGGGGELQTIAGTSLIGGVAPINALNVRRVANIPDSFSTTFFSSGASGTPGSQSVSPF